MCYCHFENNNDNDHRTDGTTNFEQTASMIINNNRTLIKNNRSVAKVGTELSYFLNIFSDNNGFHF